MNRVWISLAVCLLLTAVPGCGDTPQVLVHDMLVFWNEVCDNMIKATSEEKAKQLVMLQFKLLDKRHENLKERADKKLVRFDKDEAMELENALLDYCDEIKAVEARLKHCQERLKKMITAGLESGQLTPNLALIYTWPDREKKVFEKTHYGSFMPDLKAKRVEPYQLGFGLVPARPDFDYKKRQQKAK